jgi:hypothetical protein
MVMLRSSLQAANISIDLGLGIIILLVFFLPSLVRNRPELLENLVLLLVLFYPIKFFENAYKNQLVWKGVLYYISGMKTELIFVDSWNCLNLNNIVG